MADTTSHVPSPGFLKEMRAVELWGMSPPRMTDDILPRFNWESPLRGMSRCGTGAVACSTAARNNSSCCVGERNITFIPNESQVGIDVGIARYYTLFDGNPIDTYQSNPKFFYQLQDKLKAVQRSLARKVKRSANWYKQLKIVKRIYALIARKIGPPMRAVPIVHGGGVAWCDGQESTAAAER